MKGILCIFATYIVVFMQMLDTSIVALALPKMASSLQIDVYDSVWVMTSFGVGIATSFAMVKVVSGQFGVNATFRVSILAFIVSSVACGLFHGIVEFLIFRYFQGLSSGFLVLLSQNIFISLYGNDRRAMAFSIWGSAVAIAPVAGPFVGGLMTEHLGWESLFYINLPIMTFSYFVLDAHLRQNDIANTKEKINYIATLALVLFIVTFQLVIDFGEKQNWFENKLIVLLSIVSSLSLLVFCYTNSRSSGIPKVLDFSVFKHSEFAYFTVLGALGHAIVFSSLIYLPTWLQASYGMPVIHSGVIVAIGGIATFIISPLVGRIRSTDFHYLLTIASFVLIAASFLLMTHYESDSSMSELIWPRILMGVGLAMFYSPISSISFAKLKPTEIVNANAILLIVRVVMTNISMSLIYQLLKTYKHSAYQRIALQNTQPNTSIETDAALAQHYLVENYASTLAMQKIFNLAFIALAVMFVFLTFYSIKYFVKLQQEKVKI